MESEGPFNLSRSNGVCDPQWALSSPPYTVQWSEDGLRLNGDLVPFRTCRNSTLAKNRKGPPPPHRSPWRMVAALEHQLRNDSLVLGLDEETATVLPPREASMAVPEAGVATVARPPAYETALARRISYHGHTMVVPLAQFGEGVDINPFNLKPMLHEDGLGHLT